MCLLSAILAPVILVLALPVLIALGIHCNRRYAFRPRICNKQTLENR